MFWVRFQHDLGIAWKDLKIADFTNDRRDELVTFYRDDMEFATKDVDIPKNLLRWMAMKSGSRH